MGGFIDMSGQKYGMLTVIERNGTSKDNQATWKCKCDCGNYHTVKGRDLRRGGVKSCGCMSVEWTKKSKIKHEKSDTRLYNVWLSMKNRCYRKNVKEYHLYGGRGIKVCDEWQEFVPFMKWAYANGYDENAPRGQCTIDRIDSNGDYCPGNCRWVDEIVQANNRRSNVFYAFNGETHTLSEWARITGIKRATLWARINIQNWNIGKALGME